MLYLYFTLFPLPRVESQAVVVAAKGNCRTFWEIKDLKRGMDGQLPFLLLSPSPSLPLPLPLLLSYRQRQGNGQTKRSIGQTIKQKEGENQRGNK